VQPAETVVAEQRRIALAQRVPDRHHTAMFAAWSAHPHTHQTRPARGTKGVRTLRHGCRRSGSAGAGCGPAAA
jgi:hypothetical protein